MRLSTLARRSVATLAATALLTTGGAALGLTTGVANAQTVTGVSRAGGGPATGLNNGPSAFQVSGSDFMPSNQQSVSIHPSNPTPRQGSIAGVVRDNSAQCAKVLGQVLPDAQCDGPLVFDINLSTAAPGFYDLVVTQDPFNGPNDVDSISNAILVVSAGAATTTGVAPSGTSNGPLTITGTNFERGAVVKFFSTDAAGNATVEDPLLSIDPTTINYVSSTTLTGVYTANPAAGGRKVVRVFNLQDSQVAGPGPTFYQPRVTSINPSTLGQGVTASIVNVNGTGFSANSTVAWSDPKVTASGPITLTAQGFNVPTSVAADTPPGPKSLTVKDTGGGYTTFSNGLTVTAAPRPTSVVPNTRGQGSIGEVTINGSGFTLNTLFTFGQGTIASTLVTTTATVAKVNLQVSSDADLGVRSLTATNPDKGTSTLANALTVVAKPIISQISPGSGARAQSVPVTITGSGFETTGVTITVSGNGVTVGATTVDSPTKIRTTFNIAGDAAFDPRNVTIVNNGTQGTSTCTGCFGINSMAVSPAGAPNDGVKTLTFTGAGLNGTSSFTLSIPGGQTYQPVINGTTVACSAPAADKACATFNLNGVASGYYTTTATTGTSVLTCTSCFLVVSNTNPAPTTATPASGGQGAVNRTIVIGGSGFSPGETVTFTGNGITVGQVTYNSPSQLTVVISIAEDAPAGPRGFTVTNIGDGHSGSSAPNAFTVNAGPKVTGTDTNGLGQNAVSDVTLTGSGFASGATADFGPGTSAVVKSVSATVLVATVTVADDAAPTVRDIRVTNSDGGSGALVGLFKVNPAPRITSIAPGFGKPGETKSVVINGSGFATQPATPSNNTTPTVCPEGSSPATTCPTVIVAGLLATVKTVSVDGTSMTAEFAIGQQSPISNPAAKVINPDRGQSVKLAAFRIATVPVAPIDVALSSNNNGTVTVTWGFPTTTNADGGSPLTGFIVDDGDAATNNTQTVGPNVRTATFTGLTPGKVYAFTVKAGNEVGVGPAATASTSQYVTSLTATRSKPIATAGDLIHYTGKLTRTANGAGAPGAAIIVTLDPDVGPTRVFTTYTNAIGVWGFRFPTYYNMTVSAKFNGNATDKAHTANTFRLGTFLRIVKKTPGNNSRVAGRGFHVTGYANFATGGRTVYLVRGNGSLVAKTILRGDRTFDFIAKLPRGTTYLRVEMAAGGGNLRSGSDYFLVHSQ